MNKKMTLLLLCCLNIMLVQAQNLAKVDMVNTLWAPILNPIFLMATRTQPLAHHGA